MPSVRQEQERPLIWRGPFIAKRAGRFNWVIVNRYGEVERTGFGTKQGADERCALMNAATEQCDQVTQDR